jgi:hypothetical protein
VVIDGDPEGHANARLIAAAPALLEALRTALSALTAIAEDDNPVATAALDTGYAAIRQATGEGETA